MDVSVIVPFYKNLEWLYQAIDSIEEPPNIMYEIIIVNDGSAEVIDKAKISRHTKRIKIVHQQNQGPGAARNNGIRIATGKFITFLDSDDLYVKNKLATQFAFMKQNKLDWCHSSYIKFFEDGSEEVVDNSEFWGYVFPKCLAYNPIATPTVMIKKEALESLEIKFSEEMRFGQDGFLWSQLASRYFVGVIPEPIVLVRMRGTNATLSVKNHLYVKSKMYSYLREKDKFYNGNKIPKLMQSMFAIANTNFKIVQSMSRYLRNDNNIELLSKILYFPEYIVFRVYKLKSNKSKKVNRMGHNK